MSQEQEKLKSRKGKNFVAEEEKQLCWSFLHISQHPPTGIGQKNTAFWERIAEHYNTHRPSGCAARPSRSLETKWGIIKHDVNKFIECYGSVTLLKESGTNTEDTLQKALELYKTKHPKSQSFVFIHCWFILKDIPKWADTREREEVKKLTPIKRKSLVSEVEPGIEVVDQIDMVLSSNGSERLKVCKVAKEEEKQRKFKGQGRSQAKAMDALASASLRRVELLENESAMALFSIPEDQLASFSDDAKRYFMLRRKEELMKLESRLAAKETTKEVLPAQAPTQGREEGNLVPTRLAPFIDVQNQIVVYEDKEKEEE